MSIWDTLNANPLYGRRPSYQYGGLPLVRGQTSFTAYLPQSAPQVQQANLSTAYQAAYNQARAANEARYADMMRGYEALRGEAERAFSGAGEQERADINQAWREQAAAGQQGLVSSGLAGTTVAPTLAMGYERQRQAELARSRERTTQARYAAISGVEQARLSAMERRTDEYPDMNQYVQLQQGLGRYGSYGGSGQSIQPVQYVQNPTQPRRMASAATSRRRTTAYAIPRVTTSVRRPARTTTARRQSVIPGHAYVAYDAGDETRYAGYDPYSGLGYYYYAG
jgi:hypothetical protein